MLGWNPAKPLKNIGRNAAINALGTFALDSRFRRSHSISKNTFSIVHSLLPALHTFLSSWMTVAAYASTWGSPWTPTPITVTAVATVAGAAALAMAWRTVRAAYIPSWWW